MSRKCTINTPLLRQLIQMGKAGQLVARGNASAFELVMREPGRDEQTLIAQRGHTRSFKNLDSVASYLKGLGAHGFVVEIEDWAHKPWETLGD